MVTTRDETKPLIPTPEELHLLVRLRAMPAHRRRLLTELISDMSLEQEAWRE